MYNKYIESKKWKVELVDYSEGTSGGFKSILFNVIGEEAYGFKNMKEVFIEYREFLKQKHKDEFIHLLLLLLFYLKLKTLM